MGERRRHPRVSSHLRAWLASPKHTVLARLHDASLGGIGLRIPSSFEVGEPLSISISLASGQEVAARGVIAWVTPSAVGIRFVRVHDADEWQHVLAD